MAEFDQAVMVSSKVRVSAGRLRGGLREHLAHAALTWDRARVMCGGNS